MTATLQRHVGGRKPKRPERECWFELGGFKDSVWSLFHPAEIQTEEKHASGHLKGRASRGEALISSGLPRRDVEREEGVKNGREGREDKQVEAVAKSSLRGIASEAAVEWNNLWHSQWNIF